MAIPGSATELREAVMDACGAVLPGLACGNHDRAAHRGVLPIRLDVPRAGTSLQFVKPLVVDQEENVAVRYKRRE